MDEQLAKRQQTKGTEQPSDFVQKSKKMFFSGVVVLTISNIVIKLMGLLLKVPLTNMIGDTGMGYFNLAYAIYKWFYMVSTAGLPVAISIMVSESRTRRREKEIKKIYNVTLTLFLAIGIIGTAAMMFGSGLFAELQGAPDAKFCIMAIAPTLFFICISSAIRGYFQGFQNMTPTAISQIIEAFSKLAVGLLLGYYAKNIANNGEGYPIEIVAAYAIAGLTIGVLFGMIFLVLSKCLYKPIFNMAIEEDTNIRPADEIAKRLLWTAIPITISASVMSLTDLVDSMIIIRRLKSIGLEEEYALKLYGNYTSLAVPMFNLPPVLIYPISYSIVPLISSALAYGSRERTRTIINSALKVTSIIALPCALGMSVLSEPILLMFFKPELVETGAPLLAVLALAVFFVSILSITNAILQSCKLERKPIIAMLAGAAVKLVSSYILIGIPSIGIYGTPISTLLCYITITAMNIFFVVKYVKVIPSVGRVFFRPLSAAVVCALTALGAYKFAFDRFLSVKPATVMSIGCAAIVYVVVLFLIHGVDKDDILLLPKGEKIYNILHKMHLLK